MVKQLLKTRFIPIIIFAIVITLTVLIFVYRDLITQVENLGYLGAFIIGIIANATIILPMPGLILLFAMGAVFNPVLIGLVGAAGGAIGEMTAYLAGRSGRDIILHNKQLARAEKWMHKWGALGIFLFALIPIFLFDAAGIVAGSLRYPVWKFFLAALLGKMILYIILAFGGAWGWGIIEGFLS